MVCNRIWLCFLIFDFCCIFIELIFKDMEISEWKYNMLGYIESADDRLLQLVKALAESYENKNKPTFPLSEKFYEILDERRRRYLSGESKSLTWEQVKKNARSAKK